MRKFIITIARGYGSGGKTIAQMLAEKLKVEYYDRDLIRLASEDSGINEALFNLADENHKKSFFKRYGKRATASPESDDFLSKENLFNVQAEIIKKLAAKDESCIIVGRCANHILAGNKDVLRVFIYADLDCCIGRIMEKDGVDAKEAEKLIIKIDKERASYHKYFTNMEWNDARNYDICLNTSIMSYEQCVDIIIKYLQIERREDQK